MADARSAGELTALDLEMMERALNAARAAGDDGETPVGAVVYDPDAREIVAVAGNRPIAARDPSAHAEIAAMRSAAEARGNYRLSGLWLYVTLEPCAMCAGAVSHARIARLIYGAPDAKGGAVAHGPRLFEQPTIHSRPEIVGGVRAEESAALLRAFFQERRR